ncbi:MAG: hypothetical protein V3S64_03330 [bacterium]
MRHLVFTALVIGIEIVVVIHWFVFPHNLPLFIMAVTAGVVMAMMAVADFLLMFVVIRKDPANPLHLLELTDLAKMEAVWAVATCFQFVFLAAAVIAGVYWMAVVLVVGQGSELVAVSVAWVRTRSAENSKIAG